MNKIVLIYPADFPFAYQGAPAYGLLSILATLEKQKQACFFYDERFDGSSDFFKLPHASKNIYFFSVMGGYQITKATKHSKWLKKHYPQSTIIWGGCFPSLAPKTTLQGCAAIDYVIQGYGEERVLQLLTALKGKLPYQTIDGLCYRHKEKIKINACKNDPDINKILLPYHTPHAKQYLQKFLSLPKGREKIGYEISRGCYSKCSFCYNSFFPRKVQIKSLATVRRELQIIRSLQITEIEIYDDTLCGGNKAKIKKLCVLLKQNKLQWSANLRLDILDKKLIAQIAKAGAQWLFFGIESLEESSLQKYNKKISAHKISTILPLLKDRNINYVFSLLPDIVKDRDNAIFKTMHMAHYLHTQFPKAEIQIQSPIHIPQDNTGWSLQTWANHDHLLVKHHQLADPCLPAKAYISSFLAYRASRHFSKSTLIQLLSIISKARIQYNFMFMHFEYLLVILFLKFKKMKRLS